MDDAPGGAQGHGRLRWFHWAVMALSLLLTVTAWWFARSQNAEKNQARFDREARQLVDLVAERMRTYGDALHGGVGMINTHGMPDRATWRNYASSLRIDVKYPGIMGIGIIEQTTTAQLPAFLARHRVQLPGFRVHPPVDGDHHLPIVYVEPEESNFKAIGLDMAHERNRYQGAMAAIRSGRTRITGPIHLVQDARKTAGFLLFAPSYADPQPHTEAERRARFQGMVYAPFIVSALIEGTLARTRRQIDFSIRDGDELLYDEHSTDLAGRDPEPMHTTRISLPLYGRSWDFDVRTTKAFRAASGAQQPYMILAAGVVIDLLLLALFLFVTGSERRAHDLARAATVDLRRRTEALQTSNARLERFASIAAHDLREPSRKIVSFLGLLERRIGDSLDDKARQYIDHAVQGAMRMRAHVDGVMAVSSVGQRQQIAEIALDQRVDQIIERLRADVPDAVFERDDLPVISANRINVDMLFTNLIGNALKYRTEASPRVEVRVDPTPEAWTIRVRDNGIGIEPQFRTQVLEMFRRLHGIGKYSGSGIGLALCEMVVGTWGGRIGIEDGLPNNRDDVGTTVWFTIPRTEAARSVRRPAASAPAPDRPAGS